MGLVNMHAFSGNSMGASRKEGIPTVCAILWHSWSGRSNLPSFILCFFYCLVFLITSYSTGLTHVLLFFV